MQVQNALMAAHEDEGRHVAEAVAQGKGLWRFAGLGQGKRALEKRAHATPVGCGSRHMLCLHPSFIQDTVIAQSALTSFFFVRKHCYSQLVRRASSQVRLLFA